MTLGPHQVKRTGIATQMPGDSSDNPILELGNHGVPGYGKLEVNKPAACDCVDTCYSSPSVLGRWLCKLRCVDSKLALDPKNAAC